MINWLKFRSVYLSFSLALVAMSFYFLFKTGLTLGIEFTGGSLVEVRLGAEVNEATIFDSFAEEDLELTSVLELEDSLLLRIKEVKEEDRPKVDEVVSGLREGALILKYEVVGPSIAPELVKKTVYAASLAALVILAFIAYQFKSLKFGASAVLAMLHDSLILFGAAAALGHFFGAEVDFLFVTAALTTLSFSVHDTIVVFDRLREIERKEGGSLRQIANKALTQTMVRSLNNSFTIIFMLTALILLGGSTIKWFAVYLTIGTVLGTYSSPFVAVPLLTLLAKKKEV